MKTPADTGETRVSVKPRSRFPRVKMRSPAERLLYERKLLALA